MRRRRIVTFFTNRAPPRYNPFQMSPPRRAQSPVKWIVATCVFAGVVIIGGSVGLRLIAPHVVVSEAVEGPVVQAFYSTGTIRPQRDFPIKSNVAGTIESVAVDKGNSVKDKQPL